MKNIVLLFLLLFFVFSFGQTKTDYTLIDKKIASITEKQTITTQEIANYINTNFKSENDKIRAVFYWTTSNISYDIKNMLAVNFEETTQDKIGRTLKTRKGICGDYAVVFNEIATLVGIKSVVISGFTKQNGKIDTLSHAWCGAQIDNKWYVFDPTWGSGSVMKGDFLKKINDYYFKTNPSKIISSHMPFDYLWQFLNYPITNIEFYEGKTQTNKTKKQFDFESEITKQSSLSEIDLIFE
jgi:transglutaminase/protease-like cytokinesis protein 3